MIFIIQYSLIMKEIGFLKQHNLKYTLILIKLKILKILKNYIRINLLLTVFQY
jgi:hypothetical protein